MFHRKKYRQECITTYFKSAEESKQTSHKIRAPAIPKAAFSQASHDCNNCDYRMFRFLGRNFERYFSDLPLNGLENHCEKTAPHTTSSTTSRPNYPSNYHRHRRKRPTLTISHYRNHREFCMQPRGSNFSSIKTQLL